MINYITNYNGNNVHQIKTITNKRGEVFHEEEICWAWVPVASNTQCFDMDLKDVKITEIKGDGMMGVEVERMFYGKLSGQRVRINGVYELVKSFE